MCKDFILVDDFQEEIKSTADKVQFHNCTMTPKIFFKKFHWVVTLYINNCKLRHLTIPDRKADNLENLDRVFEMNYRRNQLTSIPDTYFKYFCNLEALDLSNNLLEKITPSTFENGLHLKKINLESNNISEISKDCFSNLIKLKEIILSKNKIKSLPSKIFKGLENLKILRLDGNDLT